MKTLKTICILTAFLGLQFNTIYASVNFSDSPASLNNSASAITTLALAPVTPVVATFEEINDLNEISVISLAPVTPREACFENETGNGDMTKLIELAPATPVNADFEDNV